jgi:hypothetical protein
MVDCAVVYGMGHGYMEKHGLISFGLVYACHRGARLFGGFGMLLLYYDILDHNCLYCTNRYILRSLAMDEDIRNNGRRIEFGV